MVHLLGVDVDAPADLMRPPRLGDVGSERVLVVVAVVRSVRLFRSHRGIAADHEPGPAALKALRPVRPGNSQDIQPVVLADAGLLDVGVLPCPAEGSVHQHSRAENVVRPGADSAVVAPGIAGIAGAHARSVDESLPECGGVQGLVVGVIPTDERIELVVNLPVDLIVGGPTVALERLRCKKVVGVRVHKPRQVAERRQVDHFLGDRVDPIGGDQIVGHGNSVRAIGAARERIVDDRIETGKIAAPNGRGGNRKGGVSVVPLRSSAVAGEKE